MLGFVRKNIITFSRNERGATAIAFGLALIPLIGFVGAAVDGARWFTARRAVATAIDSAVLVGARHMQVNPGDSQGAITAAQTYYATNFVKRAAVLNDTVSFKLTDAGDAITTMGGANLRAFFLPLIGIKVMPLVAVAQSGQSTASFRSGLGGSSNLELSLMLDLTGSMCNDGNGPCVSSTKLDGLKAAATDLINIVVQDNQTPYTSRVALVPFSTRVRVERDDGDRALMKKLTNLDPTWSGWTRDCINGTSTGGGGETAETYTCGSIENRYYTDLRLLPCVTERSYAAGTTFTSWTADLTDDAPGSGKWLNAHGGSRSPSYYDSSNGVNTYDPGTSQSTASSQWNYLPANNGCEDMPNEHIVVPLSADKTMLKASIAKYGAVGATGGAAATAWSWYTLSPKWASIWTGGSQPGSYVDVTAKQANGAPVLRKVAVIMTDGAFNAFRGQKGQDATIISNHAKQLCTNMKAQGIEIFTVGLALNELSAAEKPLAEDLLKSCGTDISHFYSTLTVGELKAAFRDIALKSTPVRLTR
jgi:Flp pilus assembly protein TadG